MHRPSPVRRPAIRGRARLWAGSLSLCLATSCAFSNVQLIQDRRVHILTPQQYATVRLPVTLSWTSSDLDIYASSDLEYAVFVDRAPLALGSSITSVGKSDRYCQLTPGCPDTSYLNRHGVYVLHSDSLTIPFLADLRRNHATLDSHTFTIVLLRDGVRYDEAAFTRTVYVDRAA